MVGWGSRNTDRRVCEGPGVIRGLWEAWYVGAQGSCSCHEGIMLAGLCPDDSRMAAVSPHLSF